MIRCTKLIIQNLIILRKLCSWGCILISENFVHLLRSRTIFHPLIVAHCEESCVCDRHDTENPIYEFSDRMTSR